MKRSSVQVVGTALFLLLTLMTPRVAQPAKHHHNPAALIGPHRTSPTPSPGRANLNAHNGVAQLSVQVGDIPKVAGHLTQVDEGLREKLQARLALGLLALTALLVATAVLLGFLQLRRLRGLDTRVEELWKSLEDLKPKSGPEPSTLTVGDPTGTASDTDAARVDITAVDGDLKVQQSTVPRRAAPPPEEPFLPGDSTSLRLTGRQEPPPLMPQRHQRIADLLARLHTEAPRLADGFTDLSLRERFKGEFDAPLSARMERLRTCSEKGEEQLKQRWLGPDLVTTLDALARFYSEAVEEGRHGRNTAKGLALELRGWLYDELSPACQAEGWFSIDPIDPYRTTFDPSVHHAITGRDSADAPGKIIAIKAIGRRDPRNGAVIHRAEVIVGR